MFHHVLHDWSEIAQGLKYSRKIWFYSSNDLSTKVNNINLWTPQFNFYFEIPFYTLHDLLNKILFSMMNRFTSSERYFYQILFSFNHMREITLYKYSLLLLPWDELPPSRRLLCKALRIFRNEYNNTRFFLCASFPKRTRPYCKQYFLLGNVPAPIQSSYLKGDLKITVGKMMKDFRSLVFDRVFLERETNALLRNCTPGLDQRDTKHTVDV